MKKYIHTQDIEIVKEYESKGYKITKVILLENPRFRSTKRSITILVKEVVL